jgi:hypothetical protein
MGLIAVRGSVGYFSEAIARHCFHRSFWIDNRDPLTFSDPSSVVLSQFSKAHEDLLFSGRPVGASPDDVLATAAGKDEPTAPDDFRLISAADDVASSPQTGGVGLLNGVTLGHALPDTSSPVRGSCKRVPKQGSVTDFGVRRMNRGNKQQGSK